MKLVVVGLLMGFHAVEVVTAGVFPDRIVSTDGRPVTWTADWSTDTRVEFLGPTNLTLYARCDISNINETLQQGIFCFISKSPRKEICANMQSNLCTKTLKIEQVEADITFDPQSGLNATLLNVPPDKELPLVFVTCRLETKRRGSFTSNQLFLLDFRKNFPRKVWERSEVVELRRNSPSTVKCLQTSLGIDKKLNVSSERFRQPAVPVTFEWFLCNGTRSAAECDRTKTSLWDAASFYDWPVQVWPDGELYSPFVPAAAVPKLQNKQLICYLMNKPAAFYSSPLKIVESTKSVSKLDMIRPPIDAVKVILYNSTDYSLTLPCLFKVPPVRIRISWRIRKGIKTTILEAGKTNKEFGVSVSAQSDTITLRGPFYAGTIDFLTCGVIPEDDTMDEDVGAYEVIIKGPPKIKDSVPKSLHLPFRGFVRLRCDFQNPDRIIPNLAVMGKEINFQSIRTINNSKKAINNSYKTAINFTVNMIQPKKGDIIVYEEWNGDNKTSSHFVDCIGLQPPFIQRTRVELNTRINVILTVPKSCTDSCLINCFLATTLSKGVVAIMKVFTQKDKGCNSNGTFVGQKKISAESSPANYALRLNHNATFVRCSVQLKSNFCGHRITEECEISPVFFVKAKGCCSTRIWIALGILFGVLFFFILILFCLWRKQRINRRRNPPSQRQVYDEQKKLNKLDV